ncbi:MAG: acyl-CoA dehydratase activase-related protein [Mahellales bacterium]|jgi:predicted nucleotide-binding protein (sugar kinase/HSP70/actin superfamily)
MKVSFPYMGNVHHYYKLMHLLGHEVIMPPRPSQRTVDLGVKYSPEFACFPMKVMLGTYLEVIEKGAEVIVSSGGKGPCRAGFYGETQRAILKNMGFDTQLLIVDGPYIGIRKLLKIISIIKGKNSWRRLFQVGTIIYRQMKYMDELEKQIQVMKAHEIKKGDCKRVWNKIVSLFNEKDTKEGLDDAYNQSKELLSSIPLHQVKEEERIKVGIVGEIYVVMEPSVNLDLEDFLASKGVEVERSQYISEWVDANLIPKSFKKDNNLHERILEKGKKYIEIIIGGHAKETMGHIVDYKERGFDGVIHLMPFGCLPELVSQSIMPSVMRDLDIPVLTLAIDEQTAVANVYTRVEAFIDLIRAKKFEHNTKKEEVAFV